MKGSRPTAPVALGAPISLYVHVPFCRWKCLYCDFYSVPGATARARSRVTGETLREARFFLAGLGFPPVKTVFVGGGTPSVLEPPVLRRLLRGIRGLCGEGEREWTIEANPESLTDRFLDLCRESGVNRLSIGLQTLQDRLLEPLGRRGGSRPNLDGLRRVREGWPGRVSVDFLAGIPGQTAEDLRQDLARAMENPAVGHISLYTLTPLPDTELAGRVDPEEQDRLWLQGYAFLESRGFRNYEISNFARLGEECRHNLRYWRLEPYLGVGPAAVSTLPWRGRLMRLSHPESLEAYLEGPAPGEPAQVEHTGVPSGWGLQAEEIGAEDFLFETLMMGLRLREGIRRESFQRRFGRPLEELIGPLWARWRAGGLASADPGRYRLNRRGRWVLDRLLREAAEYLEEAGLPPLAVSWP